jgi:hypothetical protein
VWEFQTGQPKEVIELDILYSALTKRVTGELPGSAGRARYTSLDLNYYELDNICDNKPVWKIYLGQEVSRLAII